MNNRELNIKLARLRDAITSLCNYVMGDAEDAGASPALPDELSFGVVFDDWQEVVDQMQAARHWQHANAQQLRECLKTLQKGASDVRELAEMGSRTESAFKARIKADLSDGKIVPGDLRDFDGVEVSPPRIEYKLKDREGATAAAETRVGGYVKEKVVRDIDWKTIKATLPDNPEDVPEWLQPYLDVQVTSSVRLEAAGEYQLRKEWESK